MCVQFAIKFQLPSGAFGDVEKGTYKGLTVVIKTAIKENLDKVSMDMFCKEAEISYKANGHENIVPFIGFCEDRNSLKLLFSYKSGGSVLSALIKHNKYRSSQVEDVKHVIKMALDAARGLKYLHSERVIHRDVALRNMLLDESDNLW